MYFVLEEGGLVVEAARSPLHVAHPLPVVPGQINQTFVRPPSALRLHGLAQRRRQAIIMYTEAANHGTTLEVHVGAYVLGDQTSDRLRAPNLTPSPR